MKRIITSIALLNVISCFSQTTLTLQPNSTTGVDATVASNSPAQNFGGDVDDMAYTWTFSGNLGLGRGLIRFDLSSIPTTATVTSATLYMYSDVSSGSGISGQPTYGNDSFLIKPITSAWTQSLVTWNTQPTTSTVNIVSVPKSTSTAQNYVIDITTLAQSFVSNPSTNYGLMYNMANEVTAYSSVIFASSNHSNSALHPKLVVVYDTIPTTNTTCYTSRPNSTTGVDATIASNSPTQNFGSDVDDMAYTWTFSGNLGLGRGLIRFDLSSIPTTATVTSADIYFYSDVSSGSGVSGQPTYGNDSFLIKPIISAWTQSLVTWNTQPTTSTVNIVSVPKSTSTAQNYAIDITTLAQGFVSNPSTNYGLMYNMANEVTAYSSVIFASSNHADTNLHPMIEVCYTTSGSLSINKVNEKENSITIYPNPSSDLFFVNSTITVGTIEVYNNMGELVKKEKLIGGISSFNMVEEASGIYIVKLISNDSLVIKKRIIKQ